MSEDGNGRISLEKVRERAGKRDAELLVDRILIRRISIRLTWLLVRTPVTANQVSMLAMVVTLAGITCLVFRPFYMPAVGGLVMVLGCVLDCCDGEVARFSLSHAVAIPAMFIAAGIGLLVRTGSVSSLAYGTIAAIAGTNPAKTALNVIKSIYGSSPAPKTEQESNAPPGGLRPSIKALYLKTLGRVAIFPNSLFVVSLATFVDVAAFPRVERGALYYVTFFYAVLLSLEQVAAAASWSRESRLAQEVQ